jgi:hypothetical protein
MKVKIVYKSPKFHSEQDELFSNSKILILNILPMFIILHY